MREAFKAFKATKGEDRRGHQALNDRFGNGRRVRSDPHGEQYLGSAGQERAEQMMASSRRCWRWPATPTASPRKVPQLQAQLNEVVRAMSAGGARPARCTPRCNRW
jgi:twitching motility protein PilJ